MAKREWGAKHTCAECGVKFYDLHRRPIACPKCGNTIEIESVRPNRRRPAAEPSPAVSKDTAVAGIADEAADEAGEGLVDEIDEDDDDLVEEIDDAEPTRPAK